MSAWPAAFGLLSLWTPINLFQTLRGGYDSSILGALIKTFIVWLISVTSFGFLVAGPDALHPFPDVGPAFALLRPDRQSRRDRPSHHPHRP
jgi:hypothetical protein